MIKHFAITAAATTIKNERNNKSSFTFTKIITFLFLCLVCALLLIVEFVCEM